MNTLTATGQPNLSGKGLRSRGSSISKITIPANGTAGIDAFGVAFYIVQATSDIGVKTNLTVFKGYKQGTGEKFTDDFEFQRLEFSNNNSFPVVAFVWYGFGEYIDRRFELLDAPTEIQGFSGNLAGASGLTFDGVPSDNKIRRKYAIVTNLDPAAKLQIRDASGNPMATVFKEQNFIVDTSSEFEVYNTTGSTIAYQVAEYWYVNNSG